MKNNKFPITTVAFDFGGVLAYFITEEEIQQMAKLAEVDFDKFDLSLWKYRPKLDSGEYTNNQYWSKVLDNCSSPASREKIIDPLTKIDLKGFSLMNENMLLWAKTLQTNNFKTVIISNMAKTTYKALIENQKWLQYFDFSVISGIIGINKPDSRIFDYAINKTKSEAGEILFIDDMAANVESSKQLGLKSILFRDTKKLKQDLINYYPYLPTEGLV